MKRIVRKKLAERLTTPLDSITDPVQLATALCTPESREIRTYSDRLRASSLIGCCVREQIIGHMIGRRKTVTVPPALAVIFDIGNSVHRVTQNDPRWFRDKLIGRWRCQSCHWESEIGKAPRACGGCGGSSEAIIYRELMLKTEGLEGHPDGFLEVVSVVRVLEVKTLDKEIYPRLTAPMGDHEYQLNAYLYMGDKLREKLPFKLDTEMGYICYISKGAVPMNVSPYKIFPVTRNAIVTKGVIEKVKLFNDCYDPTLRQILRKPPLLETCERTQFTDSKSKFCPVGRECREMYEKGS